MVNSALLASCLLLGGDPHLVSAIIQHESGWRPYAFNINRWDGEKFKSHDGEEAVTAAMTFAESGYTVDVGLMQVSSPNLKKFGISIPAAFESCRNVQLGERILMDNLETASNSGFIGDKAIKVALSLYNTGSQTRGFKNGYVEKVWKIYAENTGGYLARTSNTSIPWPGTSELSLPWVEAMK